MLKSNLSVSRLVSLVMLVLSVCLVSLSCRKHHHDDTQNTTPPKKKGALLFWTNDGAKLNSCGPFTVKLSNGQQANITGFYFVAPANCVNQWGGYFYVDEGTYTYQVITKNASGCSIPNGSVTVTGDRCNMERLQ